MASNARDIGAAKSDVDKEVAAAAQAEPKATTVEDFGDVPDPDEDDLDDLDGKYLSIFKGGIGPS